MDRPGQRRSRPIDGLLLVDKPAGITSHDAVNAARRALGVKRIGHAGTLDPFATGLLVLLVGRATRLAPYLSGEPKVYEAAVRFGVETDTDDCTGAPTRSAAPPDFASIERAIATLTGRLEQLPPNYSAKQVGGRRAYDAARAGTPLSLRPVSVTVERWQLRAFDGRTLAATITCSGGTYVRALARDLGRAAESAAHLAALRRVRSGIFRVEDAASLGALSHERPALRPLLDGLESLPVDTLDAASLVRVVRGLPVAARVPGDSGARAALVDERGALVAIAEREGERWQPRVVLRDA